MDHRQPHHVPCTFQLNPLAFACIRLLGSLADYKGCSTHRIPFLCSESGMVSHLHMFTCMLVKQ